MKKLLLSLLLLFAPIASAQTVAPFQGLGQVQFFDNNGNLLTNGVLYSFAAGTSTQQATYTDSSGMTQNVNPITFGTGARAAIWTTIGLNYKFVLCVQNDGAACAPGDVLFSVDNVPGGGTSGGGGSSPFTGIFISGTGGAATSGVLRLASSDSICWRNAVGSTNLCFTKDTADRLAWAGGSLLLPEVVVPTAVANFDLLWADSGTHRWRMNPNNTGNLFFTGIAAAGTSGHVALLAANGIDITDGGAFTNGNPTVDVVQLAQGANIASTPIIASLSASGFYRASCYTVVTRAATTSSTLPSCTITWTDGDSNVAESSTIITTNSANTLGAVGAPLLATKEFFANTGTAVSYSTTGYATSGATSMQYSIRIRLEGPF